MKDIASTVVEINKGFSPLNVNIDMVITIHNQIKTFTYLRDTSGEALNWSKNGLLSSAIRPGRV